MLRLMNLDKACNGLNPVTSSEIFVGKTTNLHVEGLFSEKIFGHQETVDRSRNFSFINLNCKVLHPALIPVITRLNRKIIDAFSGEKNYTITKTGDFIEDDNGTITGISDVLSNLKNIKFRTEDSLDRNNLSVMVYHYIKTGEAVVNKCLVIPAAYRDVQIQEGGDITVPAINDYYLKIIRLSNQLKALKPGPVYDSLSFRMFKFVEELYDFISDSLSKKEGLLRSSMLGKRVDFSGRAVIVGAAGDIKPNEIGVPFKIAVKIFEPFIIHELLYSGNYDTKKLADSLFAFNKEKLSTLSIRRLFIGIYKNDEIPDDLKEILMEATRNAVKGKVVIAKRDPALHAESVQGFYPIIVDGSAIRLHPSKCSSFNADFDGDSAFCKVKININGKNVISEICDLENYEI